MKDAKVDQSVSFEDYVAAFSEYKNVKPKDSKEISISCILYYGMMAGGIGAILLLLFNSGFIVFSLTADTPAKVIANFIILGFIAGFFERFVPDILDQTKEKMLNRKVEDNAMPKVEGGLDQVKE